MYSKIFISYATEDYNIAEEIFTRFDNGFYKPWMDKKKLLPGQNWDIEIRLSLQKADFIILLLSKNSVNKRGYFQREFKMALEYCEEKLDDDIYIIPIKLDDCDIPERLKKYQWIELKSTEIPFDFIFASINTQIDKYRASEERRRKANLFSELIEKEVNKTFSVNLESDCIVKINYPQFKDINNEDCQLLNAFITSAVFKNYTDFINQIFKITNNPFEKKISYAIYIDFQIKLLTKDFFSLVIFIRRDDAHFRSYYKSSAYNYKLSPLFEFTINDLFDHAEGILYILANLSKNKFAEKVKEEISLDENVSIHQSFYVKMETPQWSFFENFYLKKSSLVIIFFVWTLPAIYAGKQLEIEIAFDEILLLKPNLNTLLYIIQKIK